MLSKHSTNTMIRPLILVVLTLAPALRVLPLAPSTSSSPHCETARHLTLRYGYPRRCSPSLASASMTSSATSYLMMTAEMSLWETLQKPSTKLPALPHRAPTSNGMLSGCHGTNIARSSSIMITSISGTARHLMPSTSSSAYFNC